ncbi:unnamed protein product, partial [Rotaria sp. Silwood2]
MPKNEELSSKNETTNSIPNHRSKDPIAAANRRMSSASKKSRNSISKELNDTNDQASSSKPPTSHSSPLLINLSSKMHSSSTIPSNLNNLSKLSKTSTNSIIPTPETIDVNFNFNLTYT